MGRRKSAGVLGAWGLSLLCVDPWNHMTLKAPSPLDLMLDYLTPETVTLLTDQSGCFCYGTLPCSVLHQRQEHSVGMGL